MNYFDVLKNRGFVYQTSSEQNLRKIFDEPQGKSFYIGFDPTADSLHLGSMFAIMTASHLAKAGLTPIILLGGGTGLIGDPSGKTEMRNLLTQENVKNNLIALQKQLSSILPKEPEPIFVNNADWLASINYIDFLRDVGRHFSINRMLTQDSVKSRMDKGISYLEFSYMLLQSYDFAYLAQKHNCILQAGGADQWGNMVMGLDLARRMYNKELECFTYQLIMTSQGEKMGKSAKGAIWLDASKSSPYEYYQYWINIDDKDVKRFLYGYTFIPDEEIEYLCSDNRWQNAKKKLAYEATSILHGKEEAQKSLDASLALFSGKDIDSDLIPSFFISDSLLQKGVNIVELLHMSSLSSSKGEARRLILGGGVYLNGTRIDSIDLVVKKTHLTDNTFLLRVGKKKYTKIISKN